MKRQADREHAESPKRKKVKFAAEDKPAAKPSAKENASAQTSTRKPKPKEPTALEKLAARTDPSSAFSNAPSIRRARSKQEKDEDAYIAYLESKLGWSKGGSRTKKYGKGLEDDGLDGECILSVRLLHL